jgi:transcriptional regulator with XRE-family HTH domain
MNYQKLDKKKIGLNLYKLINEADCTVESVAEFLMLKSPRVIYEWEKGTKMPRIEKLYNLSLFLNVSMEDILS